MKNKLKLFLLTVCMSFLVFYTNANASSDLDYIHNYDINVNVNDDGTLTMDYHIEWEVLDSDSDGPVSWIQIGIPNKHYVSYTATSDTISDLSYTSSDGSKLRIDLDRSYYEGEIFEVSFTLVQDYMYQVDKFTEGETVYSFTPGWFEELDVETMTISWNDEKAISWTPEALSKDGYLVWQQSLPKDTTFTMSVTYPNDAYGFDLSKTVEEEKDSPIEFVLGIIIAIIIIVIALISVAGPIIAVVASVYAVGKGLKPSSTTKVTRTLIKYKPNCPGCGAVRKEGQTVCEYCGRSYVESEEVVEESKLPVADRYTKDGEYVSSTDSNTYIRVHVVHVPRTTSSSSGSSHHSSCAHSSCACASHCACACACACAGGGRAGCSTKDFYRTSLKLKQLELKKKKN